MTVGRPPTRPRARAAARPSWVPETMSSRMNSARAAKTWKTSRPPGVVVSRFSCSEVNPMSRRRRSADGGDQVLQGPAEPVEATARRGCRRRRGTPGTRSARAGRCLAGLLLGEDAPAAGRASARRAAGRASARRWRPGRSRCGSRWGAPVRGRAGRWCRASSRPKSFQKTVVEALNRRVFEGVFDDPRATLNGRCEDFQKTKVS